MGLEVKINAEEQHSSMYVYECTGNMSSENKGGFGSPNPRVADIQESYLEIQGPSDTSEYPHKIDVTNSLPNSDGIPYEILPPDVGQTGTSLESGLYKLRLTHLINNKAGGYTPYIGYCSVVLIKSAECCVDEKNKRVEPGKNILNYKGELELAALIEAAKIDIKHGLYDKANKTIEYVKEKCKCSSC